MTLGQFRTFHKQSDSDDLVVVKRCPTLVRRARKTKSEHGTVVLCSLAGKGLIGCKNLQLGDYEQASARKHTPTEAAGRVWRSHYRERFLAEMDQLPPW